MPVMYLRFLIGLFRTAIYFPSCPFGPHSNVLYSAECQREKLLLICCEMFAFFKATFLNTMFIKN